MLSALRRGITRFLTLQLMTVLLVAGATSLAAAQDPIDLSATALHTTLNGFGSNEGGGGALNLGWTGGNLGNTWLEGEWVPYQLVLTNVQSVYPNLSGLPDIIVSYDFTTSGSRFVDLVRGIQVGQQALTNLQAWPMDNGQPYPMTTRAELENAQNDFGNVSPLDNHWQLGGLGNFQLLNLPEDQENRDVLDGGIGTATTERRAFTIKLSDLTSHGVPLTADTIVIYWQLHESRTFIWNNSLQAGYDAPPTDVWGGYLYSLPGFATDQRTGSSFVPGSSGHIHMESLTGSSDVPIPIPERLPGDVAGLKWSDVNGNGLMDAGEPTLSGWRITVFGTVEGIFFTTSMLTDGTGAYDFPDLTNGQWYVSEATSREVPPTSGFNETYPNALSANVGIASVTPIATAGQAAWGWSVPLSQTVQAQGDLNFGNRACVDVGATDLTNVTICEGGSATFTTTASGTGPFTYVWTKNGAPYPGSTNSITIASVVAGDAGTYCVTVSGACGTPVQRCATLTVNENVAATALTNLARCPGASATFTTTASGTGPFTYVWTKNGAPYPGSTNTITIPSVAAGDAGTYCVTVSGLCGTPVQRCATLTVNENVVATALTPLNQCRGTDAVFTTTASGTGPFTFVWMHGAIVLVNGGNITITTVGNVSTLTITGITAGDAGVYSVTVSGACDPAAVQTASLTIAGCDEFCSFTQGYWGNAGGSKCYNGVSTQTLGILQGLITLGNPLVVGKPGRSLTVNDGSEGCIITRMPGGGPAAAFPSTLGDYVMSAPNCTVPASMLKNGKFNNVLLGQTIALALNLRFDTELGNLTLCSTFVTQAALPGPDNCLGNDNDVVDLLATPQVFEISTSVFTALTAAGLPATPAGILELANRALAGLNTYGASLSDISGAAGAINEGFDECRFLMNCSNERLVAGSRLVGGTTNSTVGGNGETGMLPKQFALLANQPNPFSGATSIRFALPERSHVTITIFNLSGQKVTTLVDSEIEAGYRAAEWNSSGVSEASGIYFYRLDATGLDSGTRFASTGKMILVH